MIVLAWVGVVLCVVIFWAALTLAVSAVVAT